MFLRKSSKPREPVTVTMSGIRMGERVLQVGIDDPALAGALAAKAGLSGTSCLVTTDAASQSRAEGAAAQAGVLMDVTVAPLHAVPYPDDAFDVVVLHGMSGRLGGTEPSSYGPALQECRRVLRPGGRVLALTPGPKQGFGGLFRASTPPPEAPEVTIRALEGAGFRPVRVVGEIEGYRFTEGLKA